jgi:hypothetical protein
MQILFKKFEKEFDEAHSTVTETQEGEEQQGGNLSEE